MTAEDTSTPEDAPESAEQAPEAPETQETPETPQNDAQEPEQDNLSPEAKELKKLRQEAARHRTANKEARAEADQLRSQLTAFQDDALAAELQAHRVTLEAFKAAGARDKVFNDDGTMNRAAVAAEAKAVAARFGQIPTRPVADPHLGREVPPGAGHGLSWAEKLNNRA